MNVLFLLAGYYPKMSANGLCADSVIKELTARGDRVFCVSYRYPGYKKEETVNGVTVSRIKIQRYKYYSHKAQNARTVIGKLFFKALSNILVLTGLLLPLRSFPVMLGKISDRFYEKAAELIKEHGIEAVIAVNMPVETVDAAYRIKKEFPKIRCTAYLLDPIAGGMGHRSLDKATAERLCTEYEKKTLLTFDAIIAQKEHRAHFEKCFSPDELERFSFLGVPLLKDNTSPDNGNKAATFTALYAGGITKKFRDPSFIINAFKKVSNGKLLMYVTGETDAARSAAGDAANIEIHGKISHKELEAEMRKADCFVNIGNAQMMQAPSKIIEYMGYGKPIISTYRIDNDTSAPYMEKYPASLYLDERSGDTAIAAKSIEEFINTAPRAVSFGDIEKEFSDYTPEAFIRAAFGGEI